MKKNVSVTINENDGSVYLNEATQLGINYENLQSYIMINFENTFVDGICILEAQFPDGTDGYFVMQKNIEEEFYFLEIKSSLLKQAGEISLQIRITEDENLESPPVFKSEIFYLSILESLNTTNEIPDEYNSWIDEANQKLIEIDNAIEKADTLDIDAVKEEKTTTVTITKSDGTQKEVEIFDGKDGEKGAKGDNYAFEIIDGNLYIVTDEEETISDYEIVDGDLILTINGQSLNLGRVVGETGPQGETGPVGPAGNDYILTETDKQEISEIVLSELPVAEEASF